MIYFDHNATTPVSPDVLAEMMPFLEGCYANPSSIHLQGRQARSAIDKAREQVAQLVSAHPSQVIFTSGGSESNNLAIKGCMRGMSISRLIAGTTEHPSVRDVARYFATSAQVDYLPVDAQGIVKYDELERFSHPDAPSLVSVMMANNETGVVQDVAKLAEHFKSAGYIVHTDAVQAAGKLRVDFSALNVDLLSLSAHKIYGPKGVGALIFDKRIDIEPMIHGGGQEKNKRSGTENVAAIVGFGKAAELAKINLETNQKKLKNLQHYFEQQLKQLAGIVIFSEHVERLVNTTFFAVPGIDGETLLMQLDEQGIAVTSGSACSSTSLKPSHVLMAMGVDEQIARSAIRVSFGLRNTKTEIDHFIHVLKMQIEAISSFALFE